MSRRLALSTLTIAGLALVSLLAGLAPVAQTQSPTPSSVTIYSQDLAFVREQRTLDFGKDDTAFVMGLPERIDVSSIRLTPSGKGRVRRLAFLGSPEGDRVVDQARGRRVRVSLRGDRVVEGVLIGADGGWLALRTDDGATETLSRAAVDQIRMTGPPALRLEPSLEIVLDPAASGHVGAELSYMTGGLSWSAEHSLVRTGEKTATWTSRVTVSNSSGASFQVPKLGLVAGDPRRGGMPPPMPVMRTMAMEGAAQAKDMSEQAFSEYHLYTLDRPTRLVHGETQLFTMYDPRTVQIAPRYLARPGGGVAAQIEIKNTKAAGLGVPLPGGRVRVYERDASGEERFTGEAGIRHTPDGELMTLEVGTAFDLVAERREVSNKQVSQREREYEVEVKLRNRKKTAVTIVVEEPVAGDHEVLRSSLPATRKDANTLQFSVPVPAGKEVVLTYAIRVRY
jgi:hypothetical protein